ncbi:FAD-dependent monooxygenase [Nonomuraea sp. NPDC049141]|uniref:FAD-dependent monooxygenase n=1 Tax=Nonomuraea sp. NPDC049141 TaxID=3155500 RepID=UPI0033F7FA9A
MARAVVIGGGIGGLTAGIALRRKGWDVIVLECAPKLEPVGSGVAVAANALKALDVIGLGDRVRKLSRIQGQVGVRHQNGRWLTHTTEDKAQKLYGDSVVILLRADLVDVLVEGLGHEHLRLNTAVTGVDADRGIVRTGDGDMEADLIVAADGIHSATRAALFPEHPGPVYSGVTAWRGLVPALGREFQSTETWGKGLLFGAHQMTDELVYYYATDLSPAGAVHADEREELLRRFGGWHDPIPALIRRSDNARILRNDLYYFDTPLPAMHRGRVALIGDAAHPMTPNLGQGACQAIEDAIILALAANGELTVDGELRSRGDLHAGTASLGGRLLGEDRAGGDRSDGDGLGGRANTAPGLPHGNPSRADLPARDIPYDRINTGPNLTGTRPAGANLSGADLPDRDSLGDCINADPALPGAGLSGRTLAGGTPADGGPAAGGPAGAGPAAGTPADEGPAVGGPAGAGPAAGTPADGGPAAGGPAGAGPAAGTSADGGPAAGGLAVGGPAGVWLAGGTVDVRDRLAAYTAARLERTAGVVRMAMTLCKMTKLRNPVAVALRNAGVAVASRLTPDLMLRSMNEILGWRPPAQDGSDQGTTG